MDKDFKISWVKYDKDRNDPKIHDGAKFNITPFKELVPTDEKERCRAQFFLSDHRIGLENVDWNLWNNVTYIDVDAKFWYKDSGNVINEQKIKDNNPEFVYTYVYNWLVEHYRYNISDAEMSRSKLGFHFYFLWDCAKTEENRIYYNEIAVAIVKKAFIECGYKEIIEYPKVLDDCTVSFFQLVYPTKIKWFHNYNCTGKLMFYNDLDINYKRIKKKENDKIKRNIENTTGVKITKNGNYEFNLVNKFDVDKVEYFEHRGYESRWSLFESLRFIFPDENDLRNEWIECCKKMPEGNGHNLQFYIDEPYKQNQSYNWCNMEPSYCNIELLKKFGYEVEIIKISSNINDIFEDIFGNTHTKENTLNINKFIDNL